MSKVLYQKYRPQKFSDIYGQHHIKTAIKNQIACGKTAHAYLFCGPRAVGKTTMARLLAKAVNCENRKEGDPEPCNKCDVCLEITEGRAIDIVEIDAASHTGVDNVRENIISNARVSATKATYKIFIIDEVHMLSISAFNALLKTLEEPPKDVIFILATTEIHKVPATIISRCQRYDFKKINSEDVISKLNRIVADEGKEVDQQVLKNIAIQTEGCLRDAESLLGQVLIFEDKKITSEMASLIIPSSDFNLIAEFAEKMFNSNLAESLYLINRLINEGVDLQQFIRNLQEFLRKIILVKIGGGLNDFTIELDEAMDKRILQISELVDITKIVQAIESFIEANENLKRVDNMALPLELAILKMGNKEVEEDKEGVEGEDVSAETEQMDTDEDEAMAGEGGEEESQKQEKQDNVKKSEIAAKAENCDLTISEIKNRWGEVFQAIKVSQPTLACIFTVSKPLEMEGNILRIAHKYSYNSERGNDLKNKQNLEDILEGIFKVKIIVENVVGGGANLHELENESARIGDEEEDIEGGDRKESEDGEKCKTSSLDKGGSREVLEESEEAEDNAPREENSLLQDVLDEVGGEVVG